MVVDVFLKGVNFPYCLIMLAREAPRTMLYLRDELDKQIRAEELIGGRNLSALSNLVPS